MADGQVTAAIGPVIRLEGLIKHYGDVEAVRGIDIEVQPGEVYGFVGPNGAGKSTTIRCLLDLIRPTAGRIEVLGLNPRTDGVAVRGRIGYVPGELRLPDRMTSAEFLASIGRLRGAIDPARRDAIVDRLRIDLGRKMRDLSSGNRRKVALLLAFATRSDLLILDEPTSGLDPLMQHEFLGMVREARADGATVFLSSHVVSEIQRASDRVAVLRAGKIVAQGTVDELRGRARQRVEVWFVNDAPVEECLAVPVLAQPVMRGWVFTGRVLAGLVWLSVMTILIIAVQLASNVMVGLEIDGALVASTVVMCGLLALLHGALALAIAGWWPRPSVVLGAGIAVSVGGYLVSALFPLSETLKPLSNLSPWKWAFGGDPLVNAAEPWRYLALLVPAVILAIVGVIGFLRRDVRAA